MKSKSICLLVMLLAVLSSGLWAVTHTVQSEETLEGIAAHYGVPIDSLARANDIEPPYVVWQGLSLTIPSRTATNVSVPADSAALLPRGMVHRNAWLQDNFSAVTLGSGLFRNKDVDGYYRYFNARWQPIKLSSLSLGVFGEFGDDFCQSLHNDWEQVGLTTRIGPAVEYNNSQRHWFSNVVLKGYYSFRHAEASDSSWAATQEDNLWSSNLWMAVYQSQQCWFSQTIISFEHVAVISSSAVGGCSGEVKRLEPYKPTKVECLLEGRVYHSGQFSMNLVAGYRHLGGEIASSKDRVVLNGSLQYGWLKVQYEQEFNEKIQQQKLEAVIGF